MDVQYLDILKIFQANKKSVIKNGIKKVTETVVCSETRKLTRSYITDNNKNDYQYVDNKDKIYKRHGYKNKSDYLYKMAIKYKLDTNDILMFADILGEAEDFDALPLHIE